MSTHFDDEPGPKDFIHIPNAPLLHLPDPLVLLDRRISLSCPHLQITTLTNHPLNNPPLQTVSKCDDQMTTSFSIICNYRVPRITLSILTAATTDYHNATDVNNTGTLNKIAIPNYGRFSFARFANGRKLLKTNAHISICHPSLSKPFEVIFRTTTTSKPRKLRLLLTRSQ